MIELQEATFSPAEHLTDMRGNAYLEVKWRLVWIHDYCTKNGYGLSIITENMAHTDKYAAFKATITISDEKGIFRTATGHGSEEKSDFGDFYEKAETKAIGRALAACGFGTQFTPEFDFGAEQGRVVDSPVGNNSDGVRVTRPGDPPSQKQLKWLEDLLRAKQSQGNDVEAQLVAVENTKNNHGWQLNRATASAWIDSLTKQNTIPEAPEELVDAEDLSPKAEGASDGTLTPELRARLATRNEKEKTVWKNIVSGLNKDIDTWRELVATTNGVMRESDRDPAKEVWRFILLAEEAPLNGQVIDGIATVAARWEATNQEFDAVILRRFQELG